MAVMSVAQRMTADQFVAAPVPEHGRPWNLVNGEVVVNEPSALHGHVQGNLLFALEAWTRARPGRGHAVPPRDIALDDRHVFAPDVLWYSPGRLPAPDSPPPYAMPDIAVEVRSSSTWRYDVGAKKTRYEGHGLPELWLVDTDARSVLVFRRSGREGFDVALELDAEQVLQSPRLPGFGLPINEVFQVL